MNYNHFVNSVLPQLGAGSIRIVDQKRTHCVCPGAHLHTTWTGANHTTAYWNDGRP